MTLPELKHDYELIYRALQRELEWRQIWLPADMKGRDQVIAEIVDALAALVCIKDAAKELLKQQGGK